MKAIALITIGLTVGLMLSPESASALSFTAGGPGINITSVAGTGTQGSPKVVNATVAGPNTIIQMDGLTALGDLAGTGESSTFWLKLVLGNNTGVQWVGFDHELQTVKGAFSPDPDGLSFAQGYMTGSRPWTSSAFGSFTEQMGSRDAITFSGGSVAAGGTVTFDYIISHNGIADPVYLQLRPTSGSSTSVPETLGTGWALLGSAMALFLGFGWRRRGVRRA